MTSEVFQRASKVLPGGVTAAARANPALGEPFYVASAAGPMITGVDGRDYVDLCMSNGATLLGHGHPAIAAAVEQAVKLGIACAYDGEAQVHLAERLVEQIPSFEMVRFTTSGTEATFYALRIARAYTGRSKVLKFEGHFHGFNDALAFNFWPSEVSESSTAILRPVPETDGLPASAPSEIVVIPFNDPDAFRTALDRYGDELAAVIMEPINFDSGAILPNRSLLALIREETRRRGIVLIFDEILSGYRTGPACAQGYLEVTPDLSTLGKAVAGGVPLSVFGGRRELMSIVAPVGRTVHTGTYNAHLIPIMAAHAFLDTIADPAFYPRLLALSERLHVGLQRAFKDGGLPVRVQGVGARFGMYFGLDPEREVTRFQQASRHDKRLLNLFCREMYQRGVYVNPAWHHGLSALHSEEIVDRAVELAADAARAVARTALTLTE